MAILIKEWDDGRQLLIIPGSGNAGDTEVRFSSEEVVNEDVDVEIPIVFSSSEEGKNVSKEVKVKQLGKRESTDVIGPGGSKLPVKTSEGEDILVLKPEYKE